MRAQDLVQVMAEHGVGLTPFVNPVIPLALTTRPMLQACRAVLLKAPSWLNSFDVFPKAIQDGRLLPMPCALLAMNAIFRSLTRCRAHFLGAALAAQRHEVRLVPAQFVKPFLKSNKNDYLDAEAIAEAVQRPNMRFVPIKTDDQLDLQALHRVRDRLISRRTSVIT